MTASKPNVLAILPSFIPSTIIYIVKPLVRLHRSGTITARITLEPFASRYDLEWADLVVFCRNNELPYAHLLEFLLSRKIPFVYNLDDNFFDIPLDLEIGRYVRSPERLAMLTRYLKSANLVRVYSNPLLERIQPMNQKVEKVFGPIDWSLISSPKVNSNSERIKIVYATSRIYDDLCEIFMPALIRILNDYGERVDIHFWGTKHTPSPARRKIHYHALISNYDRFLRQFSQAGFHIGLVPLRDDIFHRSKTNVKFREYGACGIAGIYSDVDVYSSCVTGGETGLLVSNDTESWYEAMARLIEDHYLLDKIKRQAKEYVRRHYSQEDFEKVWLNHISRVLTEKDNTPIIRHPVDEVLPLKGNIDNIPCNMKYQRESFLIYLGVQVNKLMKHLRTRGPQVTFWLLRRYLFGLWMVLKLRFLTSSTFNIFNRLQH